MKNRTDWFDVDRAGLSALLERRGTAWAVYELIQNAWDTDATEVTVTLEEIPRSPRVRLTVEDNDPHGFHDLTHAFTLFAPSRKVEIAERRGRFNLGCKLVLARCIEAEVVSTTGSVRFDSDGRRTGRKTRAAGSSFTGLLALTRADLLEIRAAMRQLLPPADKHTVITFVDREGNEQQDVITSQPALCEFPANLQTEIAVGGAALRRVPRDTTVRAHAVGGPTEPPEGWLYELGIPVVMIGGPYHLDVQQKIPLGFDRDNVSPAYLAKLRALALNALATRPETDVTAPWVAEAVQQPQVEPAAVERYLVGKYGNKFVVDDPSNRESVREAQAAGYAVIRGGAEAASTWGVIRDWGLAAPASRLFPPPRVVEGVSDLPLAALSPSYRALVDYALELAPRVLNKEIIVRVIDDRRVTALATWGRRPGSEPSVLTFNRAQLRADWFAVGPCREVHDLLIHEFAHEFGDHLTKEYDHALSRVGAQLVEIALSDPGFFILHERLAREARGLEAP